jgi:hypothetical protein
MVTAHDVFSLILFSIGACVVLRRIPFVDAQAGCQYYRRAYPPMADGTHYLAALSALHELLHSAAPCTFTAVNVLLFSDGQPTDHLQLDAMGRVAAPPLAEHLHRLEKDVCHRLLDACGSSMHALPSTFKFHAVGFGAHQPFGHVTGSSARSQFALLQKMVSCLPRDVGRFHQSKLEESQLHEAMNEFSASVTETRLTSTAAEKAGHEPRVLRPVHFDRQMGPRDQESHASEWITYRGVVRHHAPPSLDAKLERDTGTFSLQVSRCAFDGGAERNVFHANLTPEVKPRPAGESDGAEQPPLPPSGVAWVAKESKHVMSYDAEVHFHMLGLGTQATCAAWAADFNAAVEERQLGHLPRLEVNRCYLVVADARPLFLEPLIEGAPFSKWNSNHGVVHGGTHGAMTIRIRKESPSTRLGMVLAGGASEPPTIQTVRPGGAVAMSQHGRLLRPGMRVLRINVRGPPSSSAARPDLPRASCPVCGGGAPLLSL